MKAELGLFLGWSNFVNWKLKINWINLKYGRVKLDIMMNTLKLITIALVGILNGEKVVVIKIKNKPAIEINNTATDNDSLALCIPSGFLVKYQLSKQNTNTFSIRT